MRNETTAIHTGYDLDPASKSDAVPVYQTVAYAFGSADHGADLATGAAASVIFSNWLEYLFEGVKLTADMP
jgi:O-acetylhomoserine (thiol)-lyase